jgi:hypothetical protein
MDLYVWTINPSEITFELDPTCRPSCLLRNSFLTPTKKKKKTHSKHLSPPMVLGQGYTHWAVFQLVEFIGLVRAPPLFSLIPRRGTADVPWGTFLFTVIRFKLRCYWVVSFHHPTSSPLTNSAGPVLSSVFIPSATFVQSPSSSPAHLQAS